MNSNPNLPIFLAILGIMFLGLLAFIFAYKKYLPSKKQSTAQVVAIGFFVSILGGIIGLIFGNISAGAKVIALGIVICIFGVLFKSTSNTEDK